MTKQEQIEEMTKLINSKEIYPCEDDVHCENCFCSHKDTAEKLYNAGYRKAEEVRKETAKKIFQKVVNICIKEEDFQDGTVNTQLEPLYFGIMNGCAFIRNEVKELAKFNRKPDLILCKTYYLEATTFSVIPEIGGVPIVYAGLWGKPYIFVWFDEYYRELNEKCEKILKEQKK